MITEDLQKLYQTYTGASAETITELPSSGSNRRYFRLKGDRTLIGVYGTSIEENDSFCIWQTIFVRRAFLFLRSTACRTTSSAICKKTWAMCCFSTLSKKGV